MARPAGRRLAATGGAILCELSRNAMLAQPPNTPNETPEYPALFLLP